MAKTQKKRIVVGMSGASGIPVGIEVMRTLSRLREWESHLILSDAAKRTLPYESSVSLDELVSLASAVHDIGDIGASIASGSFVTEGMIVVPCSMKTLAGITCGYADNLLLRAADVCLKERRKLLLMARECPLSAIHLGNMARLSELGADIYPLVMTFYTRPKSIEEMTSHLAARALARFGIETGDFKPWEG